MLGDMKETVPPDIYLAGDATFVEAAKVTLSAAGIALNTIVATA